MANKIIKLVSPLKGVNRVIGREAQSADPGTCWDALNILPFDSFGRARVAQRFGISKAWLSRVGSTFVQGLLPVRFISYSSTGTFSGPLKPIAVAPYPSTAVTNSTFNGASPPIPYGNSTITGGRFGNGQTPNSTRNNWGVGGPTVSGLYGAGGGQANSCFGLVAGTSTAGDVNQATVWIRYGSGSTFVGVKITMTGTGFISPGFSTFAETDQGTIGTPVILAAPGPIGSSSQVVAQFCLNVIPDPTNTILIANVTLSSPSGEAGTSTLFSGGTNRGIASPYQVSTHINNTYSGAGSFSITLS